MKIGKVESYLLRKINEEGAIHLALIDPDKTSPEEAKRIANFCKHAGSAAIMVGGSIGVSEAIMDEVVMAVKNAGLPTIIFPSGATTLTRHADAIWFMSLLNSTNTYYLIDAQMMGAAIVRKYQLEAIPMGYIVVSGDSTVGFVGQVRPIPLSRPEIISLYALTAQYLGMRFVYLEGGSGAKEPIPPEVVSKVRSTVDIKIVVGGGIRSREDARQLTKAGADIVVTGTVIEEDAERALPEIIEGVKEGVRLRGAP